MRVSMGKRPQNMAMMEPGGNQQRACPSSKTLKLWSEKGMVVIVCYSCNWGILKLYSITTKKHGQWELSKHTLCDKTSYTIRFHQDPLLLLQLLNASWRHWLQNDNNQLSGSIWQNLSHFLMFGGGIPSHVVFLIQSLASGLQMFFTEMILGILEICRHAYCMGPHWN